ncbi:MAG: signal peptide peptidase SppA [Mariprofundaceae bacterium]|nr:signal peptide peptidase SppA [Mariprofundaceae bacterium]
MKKTFSLLMKGVEKTRYVLLNLFFLLFIAFFIITIINAQPSVPDKFILHLNLTGSLVEQVKHPEFGLSSFTAPSPQQVKVHDVVTALERAAKDERVLAVYLDVQKLTSASLVHMQDIRQAILKFQKSDKPIIAYAHHYSQAQYYLAAATDQVFLHPMGYIGLNGYSLYRNYVRETLEKLSIDVHVFKAGRYKSAAAPLLQSSMSQDEREANSMWLNTLWQVYRDDLKTMRNIEPSRLQYILDHPISTLNEHQQDLSRMFLAEHWVDDLLFADQAEDFLVAQVGHVEQVPFKHYLLASGSGFLPTAPESEKHWVAVITGSGTILEGEQPAGSIGSTSMVALLQTALEDERVQAVVLRLNTPGGSAAASESIRHAIDLLKQAGKPVVVSMGSMAASGGYWIATAADEIWASAATLTGSIGVFGIIPNISRSLNHLGIQTDGLGTTHIAGSLRIDQPLSDDIKTLMQMHIEQTYQQFTQLVAQGRNMDINQVKKLAEGRVWSGYEAHQLGLVDHLGDINDAILAAAKLANIEAEHEPIIISPPQNTWDLLLETILSQAMVWGFEPQPNSLMVQVIHNIQTQLQQVQQLNDPRHIYALSDLNVAQ